MNELTLRDINAKIERMDVEELKAVIHIEDHKLAEETLHAGLNCIDSGLDMIEQGVELMRIADDSLNYAKRSEQCQNTATVVVLDFVI